MANNQPLKTVTVELSKPHSLKLLKELEDLEAIKVIPNNITNPLLDLPDWHKDIIDQRMNEFEQNPNDVMHWDYVKNSFKITS